MKSTSLAPRTPLTESMIQNLLSFIQPLPGLPADVAQAVAEKQREGLARQLRGVPIDRRILPRLRAQLEIGHYASLIEAGKSAGALASTSIGERQTQNSLSSFHTAGQQKVNLLVGVPRMQEIVNVTRHIKTPSMEIWLDYPADRLRDLSFVRTRALEVLEYRELGDFVLDWDVSEGRDVGPQDEAWYELHRTFVGLDYEACEWSVRLVIDPALLYARRLTLSTIAQAIESNWGDAFCVTSPDNVGLLDVYVRTERLGVEEVVESIKTTRRKGKKKREPDEDVDLPLIITEENKERFFLRDLVIPSLLALPVGGIEGLKQCFFQEKGGQWYVTTVGSNLRAVLSHPEVDPRRTTTNHLWDTFECLGIEATRAFLRRELDKLISVNSRHIDLLVHSMTCSGRPMPASSRGIDIRQVGLLAKIGFEQPWDHFFKGALTAERDDMRGASSAIIAGRVPSLGAGIAVPLNRRKWEAWRRLGCKPGAQTELEIDEDREAYNHWQRMSLVRPPVSRIPRPVPKASDEDREEVRLIPRASGPKKSNINRFLEPAPYTPTLPGQRPGHASASLVTRLVVKPRRDLDPMANAELGRLGAIPSSVFNQPTGEVREREEEQEVY